MLEGHARKLLIAAASASTRRGKRFDEVALFTAAVCGALTCGCTRAAVTSFTVTPTTPMCPGNVELQWATSNATSVTLSAASGGATLRSPVAFSGGETRRVDRTTIFTLTASGYGGSDERARTVSAISAPMSIRLGGRPRCTMLDRMISVTAASEWFTPTLIVQGVTVNRPTDREVTVEHEITWIGRGSTTQFNGRTLQPNWLLRAPLVGRETCMMGDRMEDLGSAPPQDLSITVVAACPSTDAPPGSNPSTPPSSCGQIGLGCCTEGNACGDHLACTNRVCGVPPGCGEPLQPCCGLQTPDPTCHAHAQCGGSTCTACGGPGQPCCRGRVTAEASCDSGSYCGGSTCVRCGGLNEPCCPGSATTDSTCSTGLRCGGAICTTP